MGSLDGAEFCELAGLYASFLILKNSLDPTYLNKRDELFSKCRHRLKHLLCKAKPP